MSDLAASQDSLDARLEAIWERHAVDTLRRGRRVVEAAAALARGDASAELVESGGNEAHQLAGLCGTFGRARLAALARDAEQVLRATGRSDEDIVRLVDVVDELIQGLDASTSDQ